MKFIKTIAALFLFALLNLNESLAQEEYTQEASVYALGRYGKKMANGDYLSSRQRTCSHEFLPTGSLIKITNLVNKRTEIVVVNGKSQTTDVELTHSVAHDLGLLGANKTNVKVTVVRKSKENISHFLLPEIEVINEIITAESETSVEKLSVFDNPKLDKTAVKKKHEFSMDFPQYEPIKFDTITQKFLINGKPIVPKKEKPIYKEKIIMN